MKSKVLFAATAAAILTLPSASFAQTQSGSGIGSSGSTRGGASMPSTGTSPDSAGAAGTTNPRSPETSVGTSGATSAPLPDRSSGRCDTLIGAERTKCLQEQAATGTTPGSGSVGAGSTGIGSGAGTSR